MKNEQMNFNLNSNLYVCKSTGQKWRRNGKTRTWKRDKSRFQIPVKFGLYSYGYINQDNFREFEAQ